MLTSGELCCLSIYSGSKLGLFMNKRKVVLNFYSTKHKSYRKCINQIHLTLCDCTDIEVQGYYERIS